MSILNPLKIESHSKDNYTPRWVGDLYLHELVVEDPIAKELFVNTAPHIKSGAVFIIQRKFNVYLPHVAGNNNPHVIDYALVQVPNKFVEGWQNKVEYSVYESSSKRYLNSLDNENIEYKIIKPNKNSPLILLAADKHVVNKLLREIT